MAFDGGGEDLRRFFVGVELQQVVAPVEEVLLGGRRVRGPLILVGGGDEVFGALVDVAEQIVELRLVPGGNHPLDLGPRLVEIARLEQREREIVAAVVVGGIDGAGALQVRKGGVEPALLHVKRCELVLCVKAVRIPPRGVHEAPLDGGGLRGLLRCGRRRRRWSRRRRRWL